jgi:hypothetical protein
VIFGSSVTRETPFPFLPLRGVFVSIGFLHLCGRVIAASATCLES